MLYTEEGRQTTTQLWNETLAEQEAFGVKVALEAMAH
jgi:hypothetical protein